MNPRNCPRRVLVLALALGVALPACDKINEDDGSSGSGSGTGGGAVVFERVVGSSSSGTADGAHNVARFNNPVNVEVGSNGQVYVADFDNNAIRVISTTGVVSTLVTDATVTGTFQRPFGLSISPADSFLYVQTDTNETGTNSTSSGTIWRVDRGTGLTTRMASNLGRPRGLQALTDGTIAMSDPEHHVITILNPNTGVETLLAGLEDNAGFVDATGGAARFNRPYGLALATDGSGALLVADQNNNRIRRVTVPGGVVTTFAGTGTAGSTNGAAITVATFRRPQDVAAVGANIYVADHDNFLIRRITGGTVSTQAGDGTQGFFDGTGTTASFYGLEGIALNSAGSLLWIADGNNGDGSNNHRVRRLNVP